MHFIKDFFNGDSNEHAHGRFTRYGRGTFDGPTSSAKTGKSVKLESTIDYSNVIGEAIAANSTEPVNVTGIIISKQTLDDRLEAVGVNSSVKKRKGSYTAQVKDTVMADTLVALYRNMEDAYILLNLDSDAGSLKCKTKPPKPGSKPDDKFCQAKLDENTFKNLKDDVFFDAPDKFLQVSVSHVYEITELVPPAGVTDASRIRVEAKRRGTVKRTLTVDGTVTESEAKLLV